MTDALPSWREGAARQAILDFVAAVTEGPDAAHAVLGRDVPADGRAAPLPEEHGFMRPMTVEYYGIPPEHVIGPALGLPYDKGAA